MEVGHSRMKRRTAPAKTYPDFRTAREAMARLYAAEDEAAARQAASQEAASQATASQAAGQGAASQTGSQAAANETDDSDTGSDTVSYTGSDTSSDADSDEAASDEAASDEAASDEAASETASDETDSDETASDETASDAAGDTAIEATEIVQGRSAEMIETFNAADPRSALSGRNGIPLHKQTRLIAVTGPSGIGKSGFIKRIIEAYPDKFAFVAPYTTRGPREGEIDGRDAHFISTSEFKEMHDEGGFAVSASFHGTYYGTGFDEIGKARLAGKIGLLHDYPKMVEAMNNTVVGFLKWERVREFYMVPSSLLELAERLSGRGTNTMEEIEERLVKAAKLEMIANEKANWDIVICDDDEEESYRTFEDYALGEFAQWRATF